jgi:hypothetical protein
MAPSLLVRGISVFAGSGAPLALGMAPAKWTRPVPSSAPGRSIRIALSWLPPRITMSSAG